MADKHHDNIADDILKEIENFDTGHGAGAVADGPSSISIRVSEDKMRAFATVVPGSGGLSHDDVVQALNNHRVTHGINDQAIDEIFSYGTYNVEVEVAHGTPPTPGLSSRIEYKFETNADKKKEIVEDEHGNVDHKASRQIDSVEEGALLALKIPAQPGTEGKTVYGETIPVQQGSDAPLPLGANTKATEDGMGIEATIAGLPILKDGKVCVSAVLTIKGDIDYKSGNVDFDGSVVVTGNVNSDFTVKAGGNIEIGGNIDKATIHAGGDVKVRGGMYGAGSGTITAGGSIWIRSVDSGILEAHGSIIISQQARMSTLIAEEDIILSNSKGGIVGGKATAARDFDVTNLGSTSFTETTIEIGINSRLKKVRDTLEAQIKNNKDQLEKITAHIKTIRHGEQQRGSLTDKEKELMKKLVPMFHQLKASIEQGTAKLKFVDEKISMLGKGKAKVRGTVYPGVKIVTVHSNMPVRKEIKFSSFYEQNEQVIVGPY